MVLANMTYLYFKDPALLAERRKRPGADNQNGRAAVMLRGIYTLAMAWLVSLPLDAARFHWSPPVPLWIIYFGCLLLMIGAPLLVGSVAGLLLTALGTIGLAARIVGEERMLRTELKPYAEYTQTIRYGLIPFVW
jgi:hypothetical protein